MGIRFLNNTVPEADPAEISEREYWQQEKEKVVWNLLIFFAAVVIVAIAIGTVAWFASNKAVSGSNMQVTPQDGAFELLVKDPSEGTNVGADVYAEVAEGSYARNLPDGNQRYGGYVTSSENIAIKWRLADPYEGARLAPGSQGKLTFYVVPKESGNLRVKFMLSTKAYTIEKEEDEGVVTESVVEISSAGGYTGDQLAAARYLDGHILFFGQRYSETVNNNTVYSYSNLHNKDGFTIDFGTVTKDELQEVNIYWIWPYTFGQMVLPAANNGGRMPVTQDSTTQAAIREYVIDHSGIIFRGVSGDARGKMATSATTEEGVRYSFDIPTLQEETDTGTNFEDLSLAYNKADHAIGTNVDYVLLVVTAEQQ